jgi:hypothetical protein
MTKLIAAYLADPSSKNAKRIRAHYQSHPMSACMLTPLECGILQACMMQANAD